MITDVIYSSETTSEEQQPASGTQEEYATLKVCVPLNSALVPTLVRVLLR